MVEQNPVYVQLKYGEAVTSKKEVLSTEISLLNLIRIIKAYKSIKIREYKIKYDIFKAIKELNLTVRKTQASFPFLKIPEGIRRKTQEDGEKIIKKKIDRDLESELKEIQDRLLALNQI